MLRTFLGHTSCLPEPVIHIHILILISNVFYERKNKGIGLFEVIVCVEENCLTGHEEDKIVVIGE